MKGADEVTFGSTNKRKKSDGGADAAEQVNVQHRAKIFNSAPFNLSPVRDPSVVYNCPQA